jgi:Cu+-exporting ATPase
VKLAILAAALLALAALPTHAAEPAPTSPAKEKAATAKAVIPVKGMHCGGCASHVNEAVQKLDGVKSVKTDLEKARTTVVYDPALLKPEQIVAAIAATGYEPGKPKLAK